MSTSAVQTQTFFKYVASFVDYRQTVYEVSDQTVRSNLIDINLFKNYLEDHNYTAITGKAVMDFQVYLKEDRNNTGSSINRKLFSLRSYGTFLNTLDITGSEKLPFKDILKIRSGYSDGPQAMTVDQVQTLLAQIDLGTYLGIRDYCLYGCMYYLGFRAGEVYALTVQDVDLEAGKCTVTGKGKRKRTLHITDNMAEAFTRWLSVRKHFKNSDTLDSMFVSKKGNPIAIRTMEDNFQKLLAASPLDPKFHVTPHTLRHSFASHLNDEGEEILVLQSLLGHGTPRSTEIYIHPSDKRIREALERLPAVQYVERLLKTKTVKFQKSGNKKVCLKVSKSLKT
jgi:site-specific recombinase XerD